MYSVGKERKGGGVNERGEFSHNDKLRCLKCGYIWDVGEHDTWEYGIYEDGDHEIDCPECYFEFKINTHVRYLFVSPPLKEEKNESNNL